MAEAIATTFVNHYYQTFSSNRAGLLSLYQPGSVLTCEGEQVQGPEAICSKLSSLPQFNIDPSAITIDSQHTCNGAVLILITGTLKVDEESQPIKFSQVFHLVPGNGTFFVLNEVFRLVYG